MAHCWQEIYGVESAGAAFLLPEKQYLVPVEPSRTSFSVRRRWSAGPDEAGNFSVWQMRESGARSQSSARPASPALTGTLSSRRGRAHDAEGPACQGGGGWRSPAQRAPIHPANSPPTPPIAHQISLALHCNMCASLPACAPRVDAKVSHGAQGVPADGCFFASDRHQRPRVFVTCWPVSQRHRRAADLRKLLLKFIQCACGHLRAPRPIMSVN